MPTDGYGNCKDSSLTKRQKLIEAGLPERALRIAIVVTRRENRHVVLTVSTDHGDVVLDTVNDDVKPWTEIAYQLIERQDNSGGRGCVRIALGRECAHIASANEAGAAARTPGRAMPR